MTHSQMCIYFVYPVKETNREKHSEGQIKEYSQKVNYESLKGLKGSVKCFIFKPCVNNCKCPRMNNFLEYI